VAIACPCIYPDIEVFIRQEIFGHDLPAPRLDVLGTSMGGILGMYLAAEVENKVSGLLLNDIGLNLTWMSIYGLYEGMKTAGRMPETDALAARLRVTRVLCAMCSRRITLTCPITKIGKGMKFGHLLSNFKGSVSLVFGDESGCGLLGGKCK
jgi:pimeloyl-ACP methyl ester carboxylesterase